MRFLYFRRMPSTYRACHILALALLPLSHVTYGQFAPARPIRVHPCYSGVNDFGTYPAYADLDGNGHEDIIRKGDAITNQPVWHRSIPGGFAPAQPIGEPIPYVHDIFHGDMDGNGWTDVVIPTGQGFELVLNSGYAVFDEVRWIGQDIYTGDYPGIADLNGDGTIDLYAWDGVAQVHNIFLNQGAATFAPPVQTTTIDGLNMPSFALDIDNDGDLDLANTYPTFWFANDGTGNFGAVQIFDQVTGTNRVEYRDVTDDGRVDVVYGGDISAEIYMLENTGGGTFSTVPQLLSGTALAHAFSLGETDIDGDGDPDLLTKEYLLINDNGDWTPLNGWYAGFHSPYPDRFLDVDGDGDQDVIGRDMRNGMGWFENLGSGQFGMEDMGRDIYPDHDAPRSMDLADMDNDGDIDIVLSNSGQFAPLVQDAPCWLPNDGTGQFGAPMMITDTTAWANWLCTGDMDGDGWVDVVIRGGWYPNLGGGVFGPMHVGVLNVEYEPTVGDFDNDGDMDLFWSTYNLGTVLLNDGSGNFSPMAGVPALENSRSYRYVDADGDGLVDLFTEGYTQGGFPQGIHWFKQTAPHVLTDVPVVEDLFGFIEDVDDSLCIFTNVIALFHPSTGTFDPVTAIPELSGTSARFADINGDGMKDMLFSQTALGWRERLGPAEFGPFVPFSSPAGLGLDYYRTGDLDGNGMPDLIALNQELNAIIWHENISDGSYRMSGTVFVDVDQDGAYDAGEPGLGSLYPVTMDDPSWLALPDTAGHYYLYCNSGTHTAQAEVPPFWTATPASHTATTDATTPHVDDLDFALTPAYDTTAFEVWSNFGNLYCLSSWNWYWYETHTTVFGANNVGTTLPPCRMDLVLSSGLTFSQPSVAPTIHGDTLRWTFAAPYFSESYQVEGYLSAAQGTTDLHAHLLLYAPGSDGADSVITSAEWTGTYYCSWDPNDKSVYPEGTGPLHVVDKDIDHLVYTIRFQNTGNAPAYDVMIRDMLSADLDASSLHVLGSSHPLTSTQVENDGELVFRFNGIQLPDSVSDEPGSHGFVTFSISPRSDAPNETAIQNTASIFFDFNDPVITNTTLTTLVDCGLFPASITEADGLLHATEGELYQWYLDGDPIPGAVMDSLPVVAPGSYTVTVTNRYGCVNISEPYIVMGTGPESGVAEHLFIAPNPTADAARLTAATPLTPNDRVLLIDAQGRVLSTLSGNGTRMLIIPRNGVSDGLYVIRVLRDGAQNGTARLVFE